MLHSDQIKSDSAELALNAYAQSQLVTADCKFVCSKSGSCAHSVQSRGPAWQLVTGESPYIGRNFSNFDEAGREFRIVFVGKERGGDEANITTARRREIIEGYVRAGSPTKHLLGCFAATTMLLIGDSRGAVLEISGQRTHVSKCFALINALSCSAKSRSGVRDASPTTEMKQNCAPHLLAMIEAVQPTIVILQGNGAHEGLHRALPTVPDRPTHGLLSVRLGGYDVLVGSFTHPSARGDEQWSNSNSFYFTKYVEPALTQARALLVPQP